VKTLLLASRPLSWINTAFPFAAGYLMVTRHVDATFVIGTLYFLIPYNLAMYGINDVFDYESDLRNPRKGGAEGALLDPSVHRRTLLVAVIVNVPFLVYLVIVGGPLSWIVLAIGVFAVIAYSVPGLRFTERPFLDSITSSIRFVFPVVYGVLLASGLFATVVFQPVLWALLAAFFLWGVASHAFGAVQDIVADREAGIRSIATAIGGRATVRFAFFAYLAAGVLLLFTRFPGPLAAIVVLPYAANVLPYWSIPDAAAERVSRGRRRFLRLNLVAGFVVTLLLIWFWTMTTGCYSAWMPPAPPGESSVFLTACAV
jgi:4-hydroxybenzoate polyprenyltransferase